MKLYYDAAYGLLFICAGLGIGYFDAYKITIGVNINKTGTANITKKTKMALITGSRIWSLERKNEAFI